MKEWSQAITSKTVNPMNRHVGHDVYAVLTPSQGWSFSICLSIVGNTQSLFERSKVVHFLWVPTMVERPYRLSHRYPRLWVLFTVTGYLSWLGRTLTPPSVKSSQASLLQRTTSWVEQPNAIIGDLRAASNPRRGKPPWFLS